MGKINFSILLEPDRLSDLWSGESLLVQDVIGYFGGGKVVQVQREGYAEPMTIPKAATDVVNAAITTAVETGSLWLTSGPASVLEEPIPAGILGPNAVLQKPPAIIAAAEILPGNLTDAWTDGEATALSIATALSQKNGQTLPWKTVRDVISASINARFTELEPTSGEWPCEYPQAQTVKLVEATAVGGGATPGGGLAGPTPGSKRRVARSELEPSEIQDLADCIPQLLKIKTKSNLPMTFHVQIELGDGHEEPDEASTQDVNDLLEEIKDGFKLQ